MVFAQCAARWPDELRADFQQYYTLDIDEVGRGIRIRRAASLCAHLPRGSRTVRRLDPDSEWATEAHFLARIEHECRALLWSKTKDAEKGRNFPKPMPTPAQRAETRRKYEGTDYEEVARVLGVPVKEVDG